jgi:hypothetical protein
MPQCTSTQHNNKKKGKEKKVKQKKTTLSLFGNELFVKKLSEFL